MIGSFTLIWGGMYLSRPDRSIPPYTVGSQNQYLVAAHVPRGSTDEEIERLLKRFRKVSHQTHDFGSMKIYPTTPGDPGGRYAHMFLMTLDGLILKSWQSMWTVMRRSSENMSGRFVDTIDCRIERKKPESVPCSKTGKFQTTSAHSSKDA